MQRFISDGHNLQVWDALWCVYWSVQTSPAIIQPAHICVCVCERVLKDLFASSRIDGIIFLWTAALSGFLWMCSSTDWIKIKNTEGREAGQPREREEKRRRNYSFLCIPYSRIRQRDLNGWMTSYFSSGTFIDNKTTETNLTQF